MNQFKSEQLSKKPFKACYRCGKPGHFKRDCQVKVVCHRCGKPGHIKPNCRVKMQESKANVVHVRKNSSDPIWEYCLTTEVLDQPTNVVHQDDVSTKDANYAAPSDPSVYFTTLDLGFNENDDFELTFGDLDRLFLPYEVDDFLISEDLDQTTISSSPGIGIRCNFKDIQEVW